ncbi:MAG: hypothetical protein PUC59_03180, partial [Firmicutes bacterium]|nr:hypothetical protein [Bacillota bacterium]
MKQKLTCCVLTVLFLLSIFLTGCSAAKPTPEEAAEIKKEYPCAKMNPSIDYAALPMDMFARPDYFQHIQAACVEITVTGQWKSRFSDRVLTTEKLEELSCDQ